MALLRVKAAWTGFNGAPGYSVFHFQAFDGQGTVEAQAATDAVSAFFTTIQPWFPAVVSVRPESGVEVIDESSGDMTGVLTVVPKAAAKGVSATGYSAVSGAVVNWHTDDIRNGRRVRGRTFLVPLASSAYEANGTLVTNAQTDMTTAANALIANSASLQVFARPTAPGATDGSAYLVTSARVPDKAAVLRSRRD